MCAAVRDSCAPVLVCHGHAWPDSLDCDRFSADEDMCLASLTNEYKYIHKGRWSRWVGMNIQNQATMWRGKHSKTVSDFVNAAMPLCACSYCLCIF